MNDGGPWRFITHGEPFSFEIDRYSLPRKRDRFTGELLNEYLRALGVPLDQEPRWNDAWVVRYSNAG